jgi:hypothetical protein
MRAAGATRLQRGRQRSAAAFESSTKIPALFIGCQAIWPKQLITKLRKMAECVQPLIGSCKYRRYTSKSSHCQWRAEWAVFRMNIIVP